MDKKKKRIATIFGYSIFVVIIIAILIFRFTYGSIVAVSGTSMYPTFNSGDFVFGTIVKDDTEIKVGDIIVVEQEGKMLIKRVYALPGEHIQIDYEKRIAEQTLGENEYYVLGDNWRNSRDSRMFGPVTRDNIAFKYTGVHWTRLTLIISLVIPVVLFVAQMTIVFIPADKKRRVTTERTGETTETILAEDINTKPLDVVTEISEDGVQVEPLEEASTTLNEDASVDIITN